MRRKIQSRTLCPGNSLSYVIFSAGLREPAPPHLSGDLRRLDGHLRSGHWYNPHCLLPFLIQYLLSAFAIHYSHRRFSPPSLRPLASGSSPDTAHPPYGGTFVPFFHMECERDSHPRLSPVSFRPIRLLVRNLCLIPQTCLSLCSTAANLYPGSGSPEFLLGDEPQGLFRILPPLEASVASAAEFLRFAILCLQCTMPAGLAFSPASVALLLQTGHPARYPFRTCHRFSTSRRPEEPFSPGCRRH